MKALKREHLHVLFQTLCHLANQSYTDSPSDNPHILKGGQGTIPPNCPVLLTDIIIFAWLLETKSTMACVYNKMA